jgi:hypothetical protein
MLRACIIHYGTSWDKCLALAEFSYNNSYQSSLQMAPFEALYGRRCRTPLNWSETGERQIFGPDLVTEAKDKVKLIQANLKASQSRQKSYADQRRKPLQFQVGAFLYLRVSPTKGVQHFGIKGKLAPRYIGPFEILEVCGPVAYRIRLPSQLAAVHDVFHIPGLSVFANKSLGPPPLFFFLWRPALLLSSPLPPTASTAHRRSSSSPAPRPARADSTHRSPPSPVLLLSLAVLLHECHDHQSSLSAAAHATAIASSCSREQHPSRP